MRYLVLFFVFFALVLFSGNALAGGAGVDKSRIVTEEVSYSSEGLALKGYLAYDGAIKEKRPGVLVVHEWWGHNDYARQRARMLAEMGYTALAVDMYGDGKTAAHPDDAGKFAGEVFRNRATGEARFLAAMKLLKEHKATDPERIAAIGYCFGGAVVLHMARIGTDIKGVASFHGSLGSMHTPDHGSVKARIMVFNGADDKMVSAYDIKALKDEMANAGADLTFVSYEGAQHSFTNPEADGFGQSFGLPLKYNEKADKESWKAMHAFLKEIFN